MEGAGDEVVGEGGILGEQAAVDVGAVGVAVDGALGAVAAVVAVAGADAGKGLCAGPEVGAAAVILEADDERRLGAGGGPCGA